MKNIIFGVIAVLWGGAMMVDTILKGGFQGEGAYFAGQLGGLIFGVLLFFAGLYGLYLGFLKKNR